MSQSFDSLIKMAIHSHHSHCFLYFLSPPHHTPFLLDKCKERWDEIDVGQLNVTTNIMELVRACLVPSSLWTFPCNVLGAHSLVFAKIVRS
jgi:hypothetical protein